MYEKISDKKARLEKVNKVKNKILAEIEKELKFLEKDIKTSSLEENYEDYVYCVRQSFSLFALKDYIKGKYTFMDWEKMTDELIVYKVSDEQLNIFLQEEFYFVIIFLMKMEEKGFNVFPFLTDKYFGYRFIPVIEAVRYRQRIDSSNNKEGR